MVYNKLLRTAQRFVQKNSRKLIGGAGMYAANKMKGSKKTPKRKLIMAYSKTPKKGKYTRSIGFGHTNRKKRMIKPWVKNLKGVSRGFKTKVEKVIAFSKNFGSHKYSADQQLKQDNLDEYNNVQTDRNGSFYTFFTPRQIWDRASILYLSKTATATSEQTTTGNFLVDNKIHVIDSKVNFYFKSTSSHVVNIEMYVCTPKMNCDFSAYDIAQNAVTQTRQNYNMGTIGSDMDTLLELHKYFWVEKRTMKFNPGHSRSESIQGPRNKIYNGTEFINPGYSIADGTNRFTYLPGKIGAKSIWFRILNDITNSGTTGDPHSWPSNAQGGVAMRYTLEYRIAPPANLLSSTGAPFNISLGSQDMDENVVWINNWFQATGASVDQQVTVENPIATTTVG